MAHIVFTMEDGSEVFADLNADIITVGRHPESMVVLPSGSVSGQHATIKRKADSYFVQDLGTTNGTRVNGVDVEEVKLEHGDFVSFGDVSGYFYATDETSAAYEDGGAELPAVPEPDAPPIPAEEPSILLPDRYSPVPRGPGRGKTGPVGRTAPIRTSARPIKQYKESSGIGGFFMFILFLVFAFVVGLHVRHGQEHSGSILLVDVLETLRGKGVQKTDAPATEAAGEKTPDNAPESAPVMESTPGAAPENNAAPAAPSPSPEPAPSGSMMESTGGSSNMMGQ